MNDAPALTGPAPDDCTDRQLAAVALILAGRNDHEVAAAIGVHRSTVLGWRTHHPGVRAALNDARRAARVELADRHRELMLAAHSWALAELRTAGPEAGKVAIALLSAAARAGAYAPDEPDEPDNEHGEGRVVRVVINGRRRDDGTQEVLSDTHPDRPPAPNRIVIPFTMG